MATSNKKPDMLDVLAVFSERIEELETQLEYANQRIVQKDAELAALRERVAMSKRMVWEPVYGYGDPVHIAHDGTEIWQWERHHAPDSDITLSIDYDNRQHCIELPDTLRLCRQVAAQPLPDGVREALRTVIDLAHLGAAEYYNCAPDEIALVEAWLAELEANSESA